MADKNSTQDRLIEAAAELFWEEGYHRAGVSAIIRRAGATSGSFYHFFPTKEDLLITVLARAESRVRELFASPEVEGVPDPIDRLFAVFGLLRREVAAGAGRSCFPPSVLAPEMGDAYPRIRESAAALLRLWVSAIRALLGEAAEEGVPGRDLEPEARMIFAAVEGAALQARTHRDLEIFDRILARLRALLRETSHGARFEQPLVDRLGPPVRRPVNESEWRAW